jgi:hypothetical protein
MDNPNPKRKPRKIIAPFTIMLVLLLLAFVTTTTTAQGTYNSEVGATGDDGSKGNIGIRAEILTRSSNLISGNEYHIVDAFDNGSYIGFGYTNLYGAPTWEWGFLPADIMKFDSQTGAGGSAGLNNTWHSYSIEYVPKRGWVFSFDGVQVGVSRINMTQTGGIAYFSVLNEPSFNGEWPALGSIEFRNLAYLKPDGWHEVNSLKALVVCVIESYNVPNSSCDVPYGVLELGPNHIVVGSGLPHHADGDLLWTTNPTDYLKPYLTPIGLVVLIILVAYFAIRRIPIVNLSWRPKVG